MGLTQERMRALERSLAYEQAAQTIEGVCVLVKNEEFDTYDLDQCDELCPAEVLNEVVEYLESRELLLRRDASKPRQVAILDEDNPLPIYGKPRDQSEAEPLPAAESAGE